MSETPRLFFDVSFVSSSTANTGIHRVVRHLLRELIDDPDWHVVPFCISDRGSRAVQRHEVNRDIFAPFGLLTNDELRTQAVPTQRERGLRVLSGFRASMLERWIPRTRETIARCIPSPRWQKFILGARGEPGSLVHLLFKLLGFRQLGVTGNAPLKFCERLSPTDHVLFVDATWHVTRFEEIIGDMYEQGARITTVVHDVIPLQFPACVHPGLTRAFEPWLRAVARYSERIICVSRAEAANIRRTFISLGLPVPKGEFEHFDLSASRPLNGAQNILRTQRSQRQIAQIVSLAAPCFLMVGTLEPRKNHDFALESFFAFRRKYSVGSLLVIGAPGWNTDATQDILRGSKRASNNLLWLQNADDSVLDRAYDHASAVLQVSLCEGFGLPVVESMIRGRPLICSEIAVFREIAGNYPLAYVEASDIDAMVSAMLLASNQNGTSVMLDAPARRRLSSGWSVSANQVSKLLRQPAAPRSASPPYN